MQPVVAVIAPGMMGGAVGARLVENGIEVRTILSGRSEATLARAKAAGMVDASDEQIVASDIILSILPPGDALGLAERLAPVLRAATKKPIYVGPLKDNKTGKVVIDKTYDNLDPFLDQMNYLLEGVVGSIT